MSKFAMVRITCLVVAICACSTSGLKILREKVINIDNYLKSQPENGIPKIIHQTWKNNDLPPEFEKWSQSWRKCLPDWEYKLHTDEDNRNLIKEKFPELLETYDGYDAPIKRVDAARYAYMATEGGLYVDLDMECMRDPQQLLELNTHDSIDLTFACEKFSFSGQLSNSFLLSTSDRGRDFFRQVIQKLPDSMSEETYLATGPQFLTRFFQDFMTDGVAIEDPIERERLSNFRPSFGTVKTLRKGNTSIAVADDPLMFNIPWFDFYSKMDCIDSALCKEHYPYAISVSHWSSSWLPALKTLSSSGYMRSHPLDNKKCADDDGRLFKFNEGEGINLLDNCFKACTDHPECEFFSMLPEQWCIGCKREPTDAHTGFWTYQMTRNVSVEVSSDVSAEAIGTRPRSSSSMHKHGSALAKIRVAPNQTTNLQSTSTKRDLMSAAAFSRRFILDNMICSVQNSELLFDIKQQEVTGSGSADAEPVYNCSSVCRDHPECKFFAVHVQGGRCIGCKAEPSEEAIGFWAYSMTPREAPEGKNFSKSREAPEAKLPIETKLSNATEIGHHVSAAHGQSVNRQNISRRLPKIDSTSTTAFTGVSTLNSKRCSAEHSELLFGIDQLTGDSQQIYMCGEACKDHSDCKFFSVHLSAGWCIGCKAEPSEDADGYSTFQMTAFSRTFSLDNKKCPAERSELLFGIDQLSGDMEQIYLCGEACKDNAECKFFTVHLSSGWCIGCKAEPSEVADGFWTYKMKPWATRTNALPEEPSTAVIEADSSTAVVAPLLQSGEFRDMDGQQRCACLVKGLTGSPPTSCHNFLHQQTHEYLAPGDSVRAGFRRLLDLHLRWC